MRPSLIQSGLRLAALGAALLMSACGQDELMLTRVYPSPSGKVSLVYKEYGGGGAAGWMYAFWLVRFGGSGDSDIKIGPASRGDNVQIVWTGDGRVNICEPGVTGEASASVPELEADTPSGPMRLEITRRCPQPGQGGGGEP